MIYWKQTYAVIQEVIKRSGMYVWYRRESHGLTYAYKDYNESFNNRVIFIALIFWFPSLYLHNPRYSVTVVMHKDKEENSHHDSHYRARELAALAAYDHHHLDGEMFLQVSTRRSLCRTARIYELIWTHQILKMHISPTRALIFNARRDEGHLLPPRSRSIASIR